MGRSVVSVAGRFVGRRRELRHVDAVVEDVAAGRGSVTVVSGEAGIGKTRLCEEAAARAAEHGLDVVEARCWPDGGAPALWPWQPILRELCGEPVAGLLAADADTGHDVVDPDRFARFAAVTEHLANACARNPVCLVIDDIHAADAGTLLLLRFVARSLPGLPLAIVLSRRTGTPAPPSPAEGGPESLAARLLGDIESEATPIVLGRFDLAESSELLEVHGLDDLDPDLLRTVVRVSGGNPLYLRRVAALGPPAKDGVPEGLQVAIERSLLGLRPDARRILQVGAVLGLRPSVTETAAVAGVTPAAVLDAVAAAADAGLVAEPTMRTGQVVVDSVGTGRAGTPGPVAAAGPAPPGWAEPGEGFAFGHETVRATLAAGLGAAERLDAHARAAAVSAPGATVDPAAIPAERLARWAHHAVAAAPRSVDDAALAVDACRAAARSMAASFAYERADALLSSAMALHDGGAGLPPPSGRLLVEWAQAALSCGRLAEARVRFGRATTVAEHEDDPLSFAEAALGLGGHWVNEHRGPHEQAWVLGLQRAALARLPAASDPSAAAPGAVEAAEAAEADRAAVRSLRVRLEARLAAEAVYQGAPVEPAIEPVVAAVERARACGDPGALAEALSLGHHALLAPEHATDRVPLADELIRVASEAGHGVLGLMGLCWRAVDLFLLGDDRAVRALEDLRARADALACRSILYIVEVLDVMLLARAGRLDEAEAAAHRCYELGTEVGEVDTLGYLGAHLVAIRLIQGREAELLDTAESIAASNTLIEAEFGFRATAAMIAARSGAPERARAALDQLAAAEGGLAGLPPSSTWLVGVAAIVEAAVVLGDADMCREAYDLMRPYAGRPVMPSLAVVCFGSAQRWLGLAALGFGDVDRAVGHLAHALDANRRLGNVPFAAIVRADLAGALRRRGRGGDLARAATLLDEAIDEAERMALPVRVAEWRASRRAWFGTAGPGAGAVVGSPARGPWSGWTGGAVANAAGVVGATRDVEPGAGGPFDVAARGDTGSDAADGLQVRREGRGWLVAVGDRRAFVGDLVGIGYIAELVRRPGQAVPAVVLTGAGDLAVEAGHEVLDDAARAAYAERIRELTAELAHAESDADLGRAESLRTELDTLVDQLGSAVGLHDRPRRFADRSERARTAVRKAIKRAIDEVDGVDPVLGRELRATISTGATCIYVPRTSGS